MEQLEKKIIADLIEVINRANSYAEQSSVKDNAFCLGQMDAYFSVLEQLGHEVNYLYSRKLQYGLHGTHRFEYVEKVKIDDKVIFVKG